jgi:hypothetical protein
MALQIYMIPRMSDHKSIKILSATTLKHYKFDLVDFG